MKIVTQGDVPKHIMIEVEKLKPSSDPAYWAKPGCKDCNGRGVIGMQKTVMKGNNTIINNLLCHCTRKRYSAWVTKTAEEVKAKMLSDGRMKKVEAPSNGNGKQKEEKEKALRIKLSDLEEAIHTLKIEIAREDNEINSYPQHETLAEINARKSRSEGALKDLMNRAEKFDQKVTDLGDRASRLRTAVKDLEKGISETTREKDQLMKTQVAPQVVEYETIQAEYRTVEKDLNVQTHKAKRRRRIATDRLDKLMERRQRIIQEAGFDPTTFTEFIALASDESVSDSQV